MLGAVPPLHDVMLKQARDASSWLGTWLSSVIILLMFEEKCII
jgi:hypothetical protein